MKMIITLVLCFVVALEAFLVHPFQNSKPVIFIESISRDRSEHRCETELGMFNFLRRRQTGEQGSAEKGVEDADIVIVGGGVAGLSAAITAAEATKEQGLDLNIILVEAGSELGGRVASERTEDGYILDKGFAVFIEEYPLAKKLLDFDALKLKPFLPGALVKLKTQSSLARVADPFREPSQTLNAIVSPVGTLGDKLNLIPLIVNVRTKSIAELFVEPETDTATALTERWSFSEDFVANFFKPFLEGIYLVPLSQQSSRMFSFVFKMFSEGAATLPEEGMSAIPAQLAEKARSLGVDIRVNTTVARVTANEEGGNIMVTCSQDAPQLCAPAVVVATDGSFARSLLSSISGFEFLSSLPEQPQSSVGCLYYSFKGDPPTEEPILILNGEEAGNEDFPVNNICFPSVVSDSYAPEGYSLCSVCVLSQEMEAFKGRPDELDRAVRRQLGTWFPDQQSDILNNWQLKMTYFVRNAQPRQYNTAFPASVNGGRPVGKFCDKRLPKGLFVCGDHMATSTLNGALESGVAAGDEASRIAVDARKVASSNFPS